MLKFFLALALVTTSCTTIKKAFIGHDLPILKGQSGESKSDHEDLASDIMITSQCPYATEAGLDTIRRGGNIFDAATTVAFTLAVTRPQSTGIGGGGFLLFFNPTMKEPLSLDFREKAPSRAFKDMFVDQKGNVNEEKSLSGVWSGAVPGMVAGMVEFHKKYGKLPLSEVLSPAIRYAEKGFPVYPHLGFSINEKKDVLKKYSASKKIFFKNNAPLREGDLFIQKDLAKTLRLIALKGRDGFYKGSVAKAFIREQKRLGGLIEQGDLNRYFPIYRRPVRGSFDNYQIYSMAPPSSGGAHIIEILNIIQNEEALRKWGPHHEKTIHLVITAMQMAFADRAKYLGDPDFENIPVKGIISPTYAKILYGKIPPHKAITQEELFPGDPYPYESSETTHFTLMDKKGNIVSSTQTVNARMGSGIVIPGTGFILNNEMDDFTVKVGHQNYYGAIGGHNNTIKGNKRPLSSMSPTIVLQDHQPVMALGTPAGTKIISCISLTILNYLKFRLPLSESVMGLRYHHQWYPDEITVEEDKLGSDIKEKLVKMGHKIKEKNLECKIQVITKENNRLHGFSDLRGRGMAKGL